MWKAIWLLVRWEYRSGWSSCTPFNHFARYSRYFCDRRMDVVRLQRTMTAETSIIVLLRTLSRKAASRFAPYTAPDPHQLTRASGK